jgi:hypothetical protein
MRGLKWVAAFAVAALVGVIGVIVVLSVMGGGEQATAQPTTPTVPPTATGAPGTPAATRPARQEHPVQIPTLPPSPALTGKQPCPDKWQRISDDVLNYSICIPPDWGVLNEETGGRSTGLTVHAQSVKILSPEGFPYPAGVPLYRALADPSTNLVYMALGSAPPGSSIACDVKPRAPLGSLPAAECQARFNYTDLGDQDYRPDGTMIETDVVVPLPNPQAGLGGPRTGYGLLIGIAGSEKAMQVHGETISQILDTVEGQP